MNRSCGTFVHAVFMLGALLLLANCGSNNSRVSRTERDATDMAEQAVAQIREALVALGFPTDVVDEVVNVDADFTDEDTFAQAVRRLASGMMENMMGESMSLTNDEQRNMFEVIASGLMNAFMWANSDVTMMPNEGASIIAEEVFKLFGNPNNRTTVAEMTDGLVEGLSDGMRKGAEQQAEEIENGDIDDSDFINDDEDDEDDEEEEDRRRFDIAENLSQLVESGFSGMVTGIVAVTNNNTADENLETIAENSIDTIINGQAEIADDAEDDEAAAVMTSGILQDSLQNDDVEKEVTNVAGWTRGLFTKISITNNINIDVENIGSLIVGEVIAMKVEDVEDATQIPDLASNAADEVLENLEILAPDNTEEEQEAITEETVSTTGNIRPSIDDIEDMTVVRGQKLRFDFTISDPDGESPQAARKRARWAAKNKKPRWFTKYPYKILNANGRRGIKIKRIKGEDQKFRFKFNSRKYTRRRPFRNGKSRTLTVKLRVTDGALKSRVKRFKITILPNPNDVAR